MAADWIDALRAACDASTQVTVARRIGYSAAVVSQVLKGTYAGDLGRVEGAVRGALMSETVDCPVLGEIRRDACLRNQRATFSANGDPLRRALRGTCPTCPNRVSQNPLMCPLTLVRFWSACVSNSSRLWRSVCRTSYSRTATPTISPWSSARAAGSKSWVRTRWKLRG